MYKYSNVAVNVRITLVVGKLETNLRAINENRKVES